MYPGKWAGVFPDKVAVIHAVTREQLTYKALNDRSNQLAQLLWDEGLRTGDHIAIFMENHLSYFEVVWAAFRSGLYLTTINRYLSDEERAEAAHLYRVLLKIKQEVETGNRNFQELQENARETLVNHGWIVDYVVLRQRDTLVPVQANDRNLIVLGAARLGITRLIDNLEMSI